MRIIINVVPPWSQNTGDLCNGSTPDSDSVCGGSNPSSPAIRSTLSQALRWVVPGKGAILVMCTEQSPIGILCISPWSVLPSAFLGYWRKILSVQRETGRKRDAKRVCGRLEADFGASHIKPYSVDFRVCNAFKIKPFWPLLRNILFFGRGRGRGARSPVKPNDNRRSRADGFAVKWSGRKWRGRIGKILFPVFGGEMAEAKIQTVKGLWVEIFSRPVRKNTTRPLTVWIVGTDIKHWLLVGKNLL